MEKFVIDDSHLTIDKVMEVVLSGTEIVLSAEAIENIENCRKFLNDYLETSDRPVYGINTGFGALYDKEISHEDLSTLQENLVMSHACGTGNEVPEILVRLMMLLKIKGLSYGYSGVQVKTVQRLIDMYNEGVLPVVYEQGSLGASGDLAPLAHLSLPIIGKGEVRYKGERQLTSNVFEKLGWEPVQLQSKEGLALLNGTQFMSAYGVYSVWLSNRLFAAANKIAALSLDAYDGRIEPFSDLPHQVRKQPGQLIVARTIRQMLGGSELINRPKVHVQDPYSFRCVPQVHGATLDVLGFIEGVFTNEINSVTDNPTVFPEEGEIISAGNFHGQPLALAFDQLAVAMAEIGSISERRTYKLISGNRELPPFLVANPGLNSGFMIAQYTAAAIVSRNKQLCTPNSVDTIDSSNGQEDHVSMGANAAVKAREVIENVKKVLGIELFTAAQALDFRRPARTSEELENLMKAFRVNVPYIEDDTVMYPLIDRSIEFLSGM